jgi:hypothetical protein
MKYLLVLSLFLTSCSSFQRKCEDDGGKVVYAGNQRYCLLSPEPVKNRCYIEMLDICITEPKKTADIVCRDLPPKERDEIYLALWRHCLQWAEEFSKDCPETK